MSKDANHTMLIGRLTRDPELSYTKSNLAICKFSIANNGIKDDDVNFFNVTTFDKLASTCAQYIKKGSKILIEGRLKQDRWENEAGEKRSSVNIIAFSIQFLDSKPKDDSQDHHSVSNGQTGQTPPPATTQSPGNDFKQGEPFKNDYEINPDDVPF